MRNTILLTVVIIFISSYSFSQVTDKEEDLKKVSKDSTDGWETGGLFTLTFGQSSFANWSSGGINSVSFNALAGLYANYKKNKLTWDNTLDLGFGKQFQGRGKDLINLKTDDKIDYASKLGYKAKKNLYIATLISFKTQFTDGFNYPNDSMIISSFMSPGYLIAAVGIDFKPKNLTAFIAPLTSKTTIVRNDSLAEIGAFGVEEGKHSRSEFGGYIKTVYKKEILKNVTLTTKLDLFSNYLDHPLNIDVSWDVLLAMKINKFLTANINTLLLYDHDVIQKVQFKELLGVGLSLKF